MLDLSLDESRQALVSAVRAFVDREVIPRAAAWDEAERFPAEAVARLGEMGLMGIMIPEAYGGMGQDLLTVAVLLEEVARGDGSLALIVESHNCLAAAHILRAGTEAQKRRWLPGLASGQELGAWCLTEPGSGSDASGLRTRARKVPGGWVLDGTKMFITQGSVASTYVVLASTEPAQRQRGITAFVVDRGTPGLSAGRHLKKLGMRATDTTEVVLDGVQVSDDAVLGALNEGFRDAAQILDRGRVAISGLAVGIGRAALEQALAYAREREQFGHPIADLQAIQWMLADTAVELDAARLLAWRAAWLHDTGRPFRKEASMAKLCSARAAVRAADRALQIHGGYGYIRDFPVERYLRDARLCEIGEGTNEVQRIVIARELLAGR